MGLKERRIFAMLDEHAKAVWAGMNQKLNTNFTLDFDPTAIPEDVGGWNWEDDDLKRCFTLSYIAPLEQAIPELFRDKMYEEAIRDQVKSFRITKGRSGAADFDFTTGVVHFKHEMSAGHGHDAGDASYIKSTADGLKDVLEKKLS